MWTNVCYVCKIKRMTECIWESKAYFLTVWSVQKKMTGPEIPAIKCNGAGDAPMTGRPGRNQFGCSKTMTYYTTERVQ